MKSLLITITILATTSAFADSFTTVLGGTVHFQKVSTWVNAHYSKTLCFDGENFHALVNKCVKWEERSNELECVKTEKVAATQPQSSTREVCAKRSDRDDEDCIRYKTVPYFQSEIKTLEFYKVRNDEGDLESRAYKTVEYVVPSCN
jgi:hypothetical protein